jgi:ribose transport system ATP-binding protein
LFDTIRWPKRRREYPLHTHRLDEIIEVADRLTVMRDGENVGVLDKEEISPQRSCL